MPAAPPQLLPRLPTREGIPVASSLPPDILRYHETVPTLLRSRRRNDCLSIFGPKFRGAVALAAVDAVRIRRELCIGNRRKSSAEFVVRLAGVAA
jgi:hypothetical protein